MSSPLHKSLHRLHYPDCTLRLFPQPVKILQYFSLNEISQGSTKLFLHACLVSAKLSSCSGLDDKFRAQSNNNNNNNDDDDNNNNNNNNNDNDNNLFDLSLF
jgi:hypothetical protein